ncbi:acetylcholinesterase precursor [Viridothelium virens]|uniref:Carboxylic ester hydrolase n=1 Tax=Viridothelium virens TaxID=1048519 RepID=A0A6A6GZF1_VIRVR|nr:acetylcholinesterase precursor [Viridothelium virens]
MKPCSLLICLVTLLTSCVQGAAIVRRGPSLTVDLGYEIYQGSYNNATDLNEYKGIRFAQDTSGSNRWQPPKPPLTNRNATLPATSLPQRCPQSPQAGGLAPGTNYTGSEDCLFLSVFAAPNASALPVFVWIHGGGYGAGQGNQGVSMLMGNNSNGFVSVVIQYRLGAFGFLSGDEVHTFGTANAGLLDQYSALQWVQKYIHLFGGDPDKVTIAGESAGGGSVMLQSMAYGGTQGSQNFENVIASSPYLPMQYPYNGWQPEQAYYAFALAAGCFPGRAYGNTSTTIFDCLVSAPSDVLQNASTTISASGTFGTWAFLPVTDGDFVRERPSEQLLQGTVNGLRVLSANNANEGPLFTIQNITTESAFEDWVHLQLPLFNASDIAALLAAYPSTNASVDTSDPRFATSGNAAPSALNESSFGTGQQQRADNLYAETTFVCPSYWLAQAFSGDTPSQSYSGSPTQGQKKAYKYQFSVPAAQHGADLFAEGLDGLMANLSPEFSYAMQRIWGNFIRFNNPSITAEVANPDGPAASVKMSNETYGGTFPEFSFDAGYKMLNLNETGGVPFATAVVSGAPAVTEDEEPGLKNDISVQDAYTWEGGRGARCAFWAEYGPKVPE